MMVLQFVLYYCSFAIIICSCVSFELWLYLSCHHIVIIIVSALYLIIYSCCFAITAIYFMLLYLTIIVCNYISSRLELYFSCYHTTIIIMSAHYFILCFCRLVVAVYYCFSLRPWLHHCLVYLYLSICQFNIFCFLMLRADSWNRSLNITHKPQNRHNTCNCPQLTSSTHC